MVVVFATEFCMVHCDVVPEQKSEKWTRKLFVHRVAVSPPLNNGIECEANHAAYDDECNFKDHGVCLCLGFD